MKVLSVSDVITNSSSEVFTYYTENSIKEVKNLVDAILRAGGSDKTCDDLFEINLTFDEDQVRCIWENNGETGDLTQEQMLQIALDYDEGLDFDDSHCIDGFEVIPKDLNNAIAARFISNIPFIFDTEAVNNY